MYESPRVCLLIPDSESVMADDVLASGEADNTVNVEDLTVNLEKP